MLSIDQNDSIAIWKDDTMIQHDLVFDQIKPLLTTKPQTAEAIASLANMDVDTVDSTLAWARLRGLVGYIHRSWEERNRPFQYVVGSKRAG